VVGYFGQRRLTTWLGAAVVTYGVAALAIAIVSSDDRVGGGILLAVFGAALVAVAFVLPRLWRQRSDSPAPPTAS
jgi:drug/metabolite transporter (DMT)-like permease